MRTAIVCVAAGLATAVLWAQPRPAMEEEARASQLLRSPQWTDKAWGAYFAGRLHSDPLKQEILDQFRAAAPLGSAGIGSEEWGFVASLFDAAVQSNLTVPVSVLQSFETYWTDPIVVLAARDNSQEAEDYLLRLGGEKSRDVLWLAANNLLFQRKSKPWFAGVLEKLTITHRFMVVDPNTGWGIGGSSACGGCGIGGVPHVLKGFPPITLYTLESLGVLGDTLLARGPEYVYYRRHEFGPEAPIQLESCGSRVDRQKTSVHYLAMLSGAEWPEVERLIQRESTIQFSSPESFALETDGRLRAQADGIRALLRTIQERGLPAPGGLRLSIATEVKDMRANPTPLPMVGTLEFVVE